MHNFPWSAKGTVCFQTTGLLPDTGWGSFGWGRRKQISIQFNCYEKQTYNKVTVSDAEASSPGWCSQRSLSFVVGGIFWWLTVGGEMISWLDLHYLKGSAASFATSLRALGPTGPEAACASETVVCGWSQQLMHLGQDGSMHTQLQRSLTTLQSAAVNILHVTFVITDGGRGGWV